MRDTDGTPYVTGDRFLDTHYGKYDSVMTRFLFDRIILNGFEDDSASSEFGGDWADRIGRRIVYGDSQGFVSCDKFEDEAEAIEHWRTKVEPYFYPEDEEDGEDG